MTRRSSVESEPLPYSWKVHPLIARRPIHEGKRPGADAAKHCTTWQPIRRPLYAERRFVLDGISAARQGHNPGSPRDA
jgi:hypothetical protein